MSAFTALMTRELKQHLRWAALAFAGTAIACAWTVWGQTRIDAARGGIDAIDLQSVTRWASAAWGVALGLLQTLGDARPDRWALLVHRPVPRRRIALAKIAAGMLLYALPLVVTFALTAAWSASPSHVARPFVAAMALPAVADLLGGTICYAAALLVGLRRASWWGGRLLPLGTALIVLGWIASAPRFADAAVVALVALVALVVAAVGAVAADGDDTRQRAPSRLALAAIVLTALTAAASLATAWMADLRERPAPDFAMYQLGQDGRVLVLRYAGGGRTRTEDLAGNDAGPDAHAGLACVLWNDEAQRVQRIMYGYRSTEGEARAIARTDRGVAWYVPSRRRIEIHRLDTARIPRPTGEVAIVRGEDPAGLRPLAETLGGYGAPEAAFGDGDRVVRLDGEALATLATLAPDERLRGEGDVYAGSARERMVAIATDRRLLVVRLDGRPTLQTRLPEAVLRATSATIVMPTVDRATLIAPSAASPATEQVCELADGADPTPRELPPLPQQTWTSRDTSGLPPVTVAALLAIRGLYGLAPSPQEFGWTLTVALGAVAIAAVLVLSLRARRRALATVAWVGCAALCGPAAIAAWLCLEELPRREPCGACGAPMPTTRDACPRCGASRPPIARDGSEIFVDDDAVAAAAG